MAAATAEARTDTPKKPARRKPDAADMMIVLFMAKKGQGGLHEYNGVFTVPILVETGTKKVGRSGEEEPQFDDQVVDLKPGTIFMRRGAMEKVRDALEVAAPEAYAQFKIVCSEEELPKQDEIVQEQVIDHAWDIPFLKSVLDNAPANLSAKAKERLDFIEQTTSEEYLVRLTPVDLPI